MDKIRICIQEGNKIYKVTSIYLLADGSFKLDVPYCKHEKGLIEKLQVPEEVYDSMVSEFPKKTSQAFFVRNRPQLSIHASGFVQFSGPGITSGIDAEGKAKGVALWSAPLTTPIQSGPTCGLGVWGLEEGYDEVSKVGDADFVYKESDFTTRDFGDGRLPNSYLLDFFVFPGDIEEEGRRRGGIWENSEGIEFMTMRFPNYLHSPGAVFTMRFVRLKSINSFLAVLPSKVPSDFTEDSAYGFHLGSPTERSKENEHEFISIHAISPCPEPLDETERNLPFIDFLSGGNEPRA